MEDLSAVSESARLPLDVPVRPGLRDHCFEGRAVLPAVEALEVLARAAEGFRADAAVDAMRALRFEKFLDIPPEAQRLAVFCDLRVLENGGVEAVLATRTTAGQSALARVKVHAAVVFQREDPPVRVPVPGRVPEEGWIVVPPARIYPELIPFGSLYRNLVDLRIGAPGASAVIKTPVEEAAAADAKRLGSPFALDAAFHAACVWGQRFAGIVAFPVAMDRRRICRRTRAGETYGVRVTPVSAGSGILVFDLRITDRDGNLYEDCSGIRMRDVSGGRLKPPQWIRSAGESYRQ